MGQRVNLQYTIDIEELPKETSRLVTKAHEETEECLCMLSKIAEQENVLTLENLECVERARHTLTGIDYALQDIHNIIKGYINHMAGLNDVETTATAPNDQLYSSEPVNMDDIQAKLNSFRDEFEGLTGLQQDDPNSTQELSE
tara:strand:- start:639 stop:1067 length:429 start_codon:yes stop_codon:yes gene_type:complete